MKKGNKKAFFLDRDGVLIVDKNYLSDPAEVELFPDAAEALRLIREHGYMIIVVSNQSGIARGYFDFDDLMEVEQRIDELLLDEGVSIDAWYYCPHYAGKNCNPEYAFECDCRKPEPGMLLAAAKECGIDLSQSVMIGDKLSDLEAGRKAGCKALALIRTRKDVQDISAFPDAVESSTLLTAVKRLLKLEP